MTTTLHKQQQPAAAPPLTRLLFLLLLTFLLHPAMARAEGDGTSGNPYVIDLSNPQEIGTSGDIVTVDDDMQIYLKKGGDSQDAPVYYKLTGGNATYSIFNLSNNVSVPHIVLLIDGTVAIEGLSLYGEDITVRNFATEVATLNISSSLSAFTIGSSSSPGHVTLAGNLTVNAGSTSGNAISCNQGSSLTIDAGVTVTATATGLTLNANGATLTINGHLYCYGTATGGNLAGTNSNALQWTFPTAPNAALTVKDADGKEEVYTFPANTGATTFALFVPAGKYTLWQGGKQLGGRIFSQLTSTFDASGNTYIRYTAVGPFLDLGSLDGAVVLTYSDKSGWVYKLSGAAGDTEKPFCGMVMKPANSSGGTSFRHRVNVFLDGTAVLAFLNGMSINLTENTEGLTPLTLTGTGSLTLQASGSDFGLYANNAPALKVDDGVTCTIAAPVGATDGTEGIIQMSSATSGDIVKLGEGAKLSGLRSFTFPAALNAVNVIDLVSKGEVLLRGGVQSVAVNFFDACAVRSDALYYRGTDSQLEDGIPTFPALASGRPYTSHTGLAPYVFIPYDLGPLYINSTSGIFPIGIPEKDATISNLEVVDVGTASAPAEITLYRLQVEGGFGFSPEVTIGEAYNTPSPAHVAFHLAGANNLGAVTVQAGSSLTLDPLAGSTAAGNVSLKTASVTNHGLFTAYDGLVTEVAGPADLKITGFLKDDAFHTLTVTATSEKMGDGSDLSNGYPIYATFQYWDEAAKAWTDSGEDKITTEGGGYIKDLRETERGYTWRARVVRYGDKTSQAIATTLYTAPITFTDPKGTQDNPYVIDLGNPGVEDGAANGYTYDSSLGRITLTADGATYKLSGEAPEKTLVVGASANEEEGISCDAQIDGTVSLKTITVNGVIGRTTFTLKGPEGGNTSSRLIVRNETPSGRGITAKGRVTLSGNLTVECYGEDSGIMGYLTVEEGTRLYGYGGSNGASGAEAPSQGIDWSFANGAPSALPVVKDAEGKEVVYDFGAFSSTFPGTATPEGFFLALPADDKEYTLWQGDKQLYGVVGVYDPSLKLTIFVTTGTFVPGEKYVKVSTALELNEITVPASEVLTLEINYDYWIYRIGSSGTSSAFGGKVLSDGTSFGNDLKISNTSFAPAMLTLSNMKQDKTKGVDISGTQPLTLHFVGDNRLGNIVNNAGDMTLTAEAGTTLEYASVLNNGFFTACDGLVTEVSGPADLKIIKAPTDQSAPVGSKVTFTVEATGTGLGTGVPESIIEVRLQIWEDNDWKDVAMEDGGCKQIFGIEPVSFEVDKASTYRIELTRSAFPPSTNSLLRSTIPATSRTTLYTKPFTASFYDPAPLDLADVAANAAPRATLGLTYGTDKSWQYSYTGKDNKPVEGSFTGVLTNTGSAAFDRTIYVYLAAAGGTLTLPTTLKSYNTLSIQKQPGIPDGSLSLDLHITGEVSLLGLNVDEECKLKLSHTADAPALALRMLTLDEDATLETDRELTASQSLSAFLKKTVGQAWNVLGVPVAVNANHTGSEPWVLRTGFTSSADQKWGEGVQLDYAVSLPLSAGAAYIFANATDGSTTPFLENLMLQTAAAVVIPVPVTPELGEALPDGEFRFVANPNLCDIELSGIYTLSADGNRFDLQEGPVTVKPFEAFMVANAVTRRSLRSIGTGGDGTATGTAPALPDGSFRVWGSRGEMHLSASHPADVKIVSLSGAVVREFRLEGDRVEQLPAGRVYLVVSGQITYKVIL